MPRRLLRRILPDRRRLTRGRSLRWLGGILHQPNLWHLNRRSVARGFAVGFFWTCVPIPFQMLPVAICAVPLRANLAIALALTWLSNPLTMGPQIYADYRLGRWLLQWPAASEFQASREWLWEHLAQAWPPVLAGVAVSATVTSAGSYLAARLLWRWHVVRAMRARAARRVHPGGAS